MVTLLFAFFVVMYSISQQDLARLKNVSESVQEAFMGHKKGTPKNKQISISKSESSEPEVSNRFIVRRTANNQEIADEIKKQLEREGFDFVYQENVSPIQVKVDSRGVVISISGGFLFEEGTTEVQPQMYPILGLVADIIKGTDRLILVEGHTDNEPTVGSQIYSNWEISTLRATSTARLLIEQFGIDPKRLTASGYAQYRPIADNSTAAGRSQNRRVEIVMLNASTLDELKEEGTAH
ncbi:MAG: OmpA/MotB domain protein [Bacteriovoracaceae bacterium]|nr:OmpA/MotB domain protein [Bacteriovoracaceae bacterium]